mgnify:FL=1
MKLILRAALLGSLICCSPLTLATAVDIGYQQPVKEIVDIVDAAPAPGAMLSPDGKLLLSTGFAALPGIADLAAPEYRLAGVRFNPANNGPAQPRYVSSLQLIVLDSQQTQTISGLPKNLKAVLHLVEKLDH